MHVFIDFSVLNLAFLSCHGSVREAVGGVFLLFLTEELGPKPSNASAVQSLILNPLTIMFYAPSFFFFLLNPRLQCHISQM